MPIPAPLPSVSPPGSQGSSGSQDRWNRGAWLFRDSTLHSLEVLLDEAFHIPGTPIRFGLDGIIGLIPGVGDVLAGLLSLVIPLAGWIRGIPYVTLVRMAVNLGIGVLVGSVPVFGDVFDIGWKANRRNYKLLTSSLADPQGTRRRSWLFFACLCLIFAAMLLLPMLLFGWLCVHLLHVLTPY